MQVGVVGLGLIGGSLARAVKKYTGHTVCGVDRDKSVLAAAYAAGAIDCDTDVSGCALVFVCLYPRDCVSYMLHTDFKKGAVVADISGVKRFIAQEVAVPLLERASFFFPEAEPTHPEPVRLRTVLAEELGFARVTKCSAKKHDEVIAYTSQLAHVVSNAYVKSEASQSFSGFSAGSFIDLTRVAKLDPAMWAELFVLNADELAKEIDELQRNIAALRGAIVSGNEEALRGLLKDGSDKKKRLLGE